MSHRALIYARVSTEDQVEKYGLPAQLRASREFAASLGVTVLEEISDEGISGTILERPGLSRVRQLMREQAVDMVIALDPDRLSRDLRHLLEVKAEADAARVALQFVTASFENTPSGELFFHLKGSIAAYERKLLLERSMRGKRERARAGLRVGGRTPLGYVDQAGQLVIEENRAATARQIFEWYDGGCSMLEITRRLRSSGVRTWSGKPWWYTAVRAILSNEVYAGVAHWGAERIAMAVPPLVSRELWERVQSRLADNTKPNVGRPSTAYLLRGLLQCHCGCRMYGQMCKSGGNGTKTYYFYRCRASLRSLPRERYCGEAVQAARLDAAAWRVLLETLGDAERLRAVIRDNEDLRAGDPSRAEQLEAHAQKLRRREQSALELMADPDLAADRPAIKRQYIEAQQERRRIEAEIAAARRVTSIREGSWVDDTANLIGEYLRALSDPGEKQEFVRQVVSGAVWSGEELAMRCLIGPKSSSLSPHSAGFPERVEILLHVRLAA